MKNKPRMTPLSFEEVNTMHLIDIVKSFKLLAKVLYGEDVRLYKKAKNGKFVRILEGN